MKVLHEPYLIHFIFSLFGPDGTHEVEVKQMTNKEYYIFLVFGTTVMFIVSFLIKIFII